MSYSPISGVISNNGSQINLARSNAGSQMLSRRMSSVISTTNVRTFKSKQGKMINQYKIVKTLGHGSFAKVLLCLDTIS